MIVEAGQQIPQGLQDMNTMSQQANSPTLAQALLTQHATSSPGTDAVVAAHVNQGLAQKGMNTLKAAPATAGHNPLNQGQNSMEVVQRALAGHIGNTAPAPAQQNMYDQRAQQVAQQVNHQQQNLQAFQQQAQAQQFQQAPAQFQQPQQQIPVQQFQQAPVQQAPLNMPKGLVSASNPIEGLATAASPVETSQSLFQPAPVVPEKAITFEQYGLQVSPNLIKTQEDSDNFSQFRQQAFNSGLSIPEATKFVSSLLKTASDTRAKVGREQGAIQSQMLQQNNQALQSQWGNQYGQNMQHAQQAMNTLVPNQQMQGGIPQNPAMMNFLAGVNKSMAAQPIVTGQNTGQVAAPIDPANNINNLISQFGKVSQDNTVDTAASYGVKRGLLDQLNNHIRPHIGKSNNNAFSISQGLHARTLL